MEKWKGFCRNSLVKMICILLVVVTIGTSVGGVQWFVNYMMSTGQDEDVLFDNYNEPYEKTSSFATQMQEAAAEVLIYMTAKNNLETKGKFDGKKIVDLQKFNETGVIDGKTDGDVSFKLNDLIQQGKNWQNAGETTETIHVCQKDTDHYEYLSEKEFEKVCRDNGYTDEEYKYFSGTLYDDNGEVVYKDTWTLDIPKLTVQPQEGDWLKIFNENEKLNGDMNQYAVWLEDAANTLCRGYNTYKTGNKYADRNHTNLIYMFYNPKTKEIYSNNPAWQDAGKYQEYLDEMKNGSAHLCFDSVNWDTDLKVVSYGIDHILSYAGYYDYGDYEFYPSQVLDGWVFGFQMDPEYTVHDYFRENANLYSTYAANAEIIRSVLAASLVILILCVIILTFGFGETAEGRVALTSFDKWKTEIALLVILGVWGTIFGCGLAMIVSYQELWTGYVFSAIVISIPTAVFFLVGYSSMVRRLKAHTFWKNSILYSICRWLKKLFVEVFSIIRDMYRNVNLIWKSCLLMLGLIFLHWLAMAGAGGFFIVVSLIVDAVVFVRIIRRMIGEQTLLDGMRKIKEGNLSQKIDTAKMKGSQKEMAELMNHVEDGMKEAMDKQMRSERMKTELITNVSHDIKTPLTSIINYVDLLKRETAEFDKADPKKVEEYLEVLDQKSQRLKTLTEDVVEASKISSGNISLENTKLDLVEMLAQIEGEYSEKLEEAGLRLVKRMPETPVNIYADGRRVWRIFGNLYQNAAKYAMPDTRVYVDLMRDGNEGIFTMKNISEAPLNIDADELTERFIRGDESRTTEGSGLGLSIAKSLTEAMKGTFSIYLDGDLFKVTVRFPIIKEYKGE